jgi:hypothetical protein
MFAKLNQDAHGPNSKAGNGKQAVALFFSGEGRKLI